MEHNHAPSAHNVKVLLGKLGKRHPYVKKSIHYRPIVVEAIGVW